MFGMMQATSEVTDNSKLSFMLKTIVECAVNNAGKRPQAFRYDQIPYLKDVAALFFILAGPLVYDIMAKNMSFPAICTIQKFINCNADPVVECVLSIPELVSFLDKRNLPREIIVSIDATAVSQRVQYDPKTNQVCGLKPALNSCGLPVALSFPAVSAAKIKEFIDNNSVSTVAFVIMARPHAANAPAFCLSLYGSDNKFSTSQVDSSLQYLAKACAEKGILIKGFSTDGDPRYLKTMLMRSLSNNPNHDKWPWFGMICPTPSNFYVQDTIHLMVKLKSKLLKPSAVLSFGPPYIISRGHIVDLIQRVSKDSHELILACVNPRDKMNFRAAEKLCSEKVCELLRSVLGCEATTTFLEMTREVKEAYLKGTLTPIERIELFWKWVFVLRMWRKWILDTPGYTLGNNFVTSNAYSCIELNGHALISMCRHFRDLGKPELFRPAYFTSQDSEDFFRSLRSMSTIKSAETTFSILEMKHKVRRLDYLSELYTKLDGKVVFPRAKKLFLKVPASVCKFSLMMLNWNVQ
ncbi:hypothetical protein ONE63_011465 [Megalurothrips usitatus]|uniref:Uncharacterized protein n=1 Tax=Megalurothrips usitatus TaxID=439358 RepID=A0AAV7WZ88_9NEOP|nr:hypothetical protein ONE63_011465 [Megalurothrips usitatus]